VTEELKSKLLTWLKEWGSYMSSEAEISFRRLMSINLTIEEKANTVLQRFRGRVVDDEPTLAMEIAAVLRDQIEECAATLDKKADDFEISIKTIKHHTGTYEQVDLIRECAAEVRKLKAKAEPESSPHSFAGRLDRDCEICGLPDRDPIHKGQGVRL
jgi:hypothetical protein